MKRLSSADDMYLKFSSAPGTSLQHEPEIAAYEKVHAATAMMYYRVDIKNCSNGG